MKATLRTPAGLITFISQHRPSRRRAVWELSRVEYKSSEFTLGERSHRLEVLRSGDIAVQYGSECGHEIKLWRHEECLLGFALLQDDRRMHESGSNNLLTTVRGRQAFDFIPRREAARRRVIQERHVELCMEPPVTHHGKCLNGP